MAAGDGPAPPAADLSAAPWPGSPLTGREAIACFEAQVGSRRGQFREHHRHDGCRRIVPFPIRTASTRAGG
jgi:hypothetical protein